jgi:hypothetical protein
VIPTILILGFAAGLMTGRLGVLFIPLAGLAWGLGLTESSSCDVTCGSGAALFAAINAAVGVGVGFVIHSAAKYLTQSISERAAAGRSV